MSSPHDIMIQLLMLDAGIVPFNSWNWTPDPAKMNLIDKRIASLEPHERRQVKRKFRKLWRKAVRALDAERREQGLPEIHQEICGMNNPNPSARQRQSRRGVVIWLLRREMQKGERW